MPLETEILHLLWHAPPSSHKSLSNNLSLIHISHYSLYINILQFLSHSIKKLFILFPQPLQCLGAPTPSQPFLWLRNVRELYPACLLYTSFRYCSIGFYAMKAEHAKANGGFRFQVALPPYKYKRRGHIPRVNTSTTVSYTHLDVYKRQPVLLLSFPHMYSQAC